MPETKQVPLVSDSEVAPEMPDRACVRWRLCDNEVPGHDARNQICGDCLAFLRNRDSAADYEKYNEYLDEVNSEL